MNGYVNKRKIAQILCTALLSILAIMFAFNIKTWNMIIVPILISIFVVFSWSEKNEDRNISKHTVRVGILFSLLISLKYYVDSFYSEDFSPLKIIVVFFGLFFLSRSLLSIALSFVCSNDFLPNDINRNPTKKQLIKIFIASFLLIIIGTVPYFILCYPGCLTYDSEVQIQQVLGLTPLSNHHPIFHTYIIKFAFIISKAFFDGNFNTSIAVYSFFQLVFTSAVFAAIVMVLYKEKINKLLVGFAFLIYTFLPLFRVYSLTMWKDIWFAGFTLIFAVVLWLIEKKQNDSTILNILLVVAGSGMCLSRSNGLYVFIICLIVFAIIKKKKTVLLLALSIALAIGIKYPIENRVLEERVDILESLAVPSQQIAAVVVENGTISESEKKMIEDVLPFEEIKDSYDCHSFDPIKLKIWDVNGQKNIKDNKIAYLKLWISLGIKNFGIYVRSYSNQTLGYWYPNVQSSVFLWNIQEKLNGTNNGNFFFRVLYKVAYILVADHNSVPIIGLFYSIGSIVWIEIILLAACLIKNRTGALVFIPIFSILFTILIATPVYAEYRYTYSLISALPILLALPNDSLEETI